MEYLQKNIPPDDVYMLLEQTHMAAMFFLYTLAEFTSLEDLCEKDENFKRWAINICGLHQAKVGNMDINLDLNVEDLYENSD